MSFTLQKLAIEMVYRILDHLDDKELFVSVFNVCQRLNKIVNSYHRYKVSYYQLQCTPLQNQSDFFSIDKFRRHLLNMRLFQIVILTSKS